ncbi:MAG: hypothetical protein ACJ70U_02315 [Nitrososphaera sp.]
MRVPCDPETNIPQVTVIAGYIDDESRAGTFLDKVPLYYIDHASTAGICVFHAHIPIRSMGVRQRLLILP